MFSRVPLNILLICLILLIKLNCTAQSVKISTYGFDNPSMSFYEAMDSSFDTIIVDNRGVPWSLKPMIFKNIHDKVIILEEGVNIIAKEEAFPDSNDALFMFLYCKNITILGNGGKLIMNKKEYLTGEWRHGISIRASSNMKIENLEIHDSGGDGIYIAGAKEKNFSEDIIIDNIKSINNKRQGLTIISAKNVIIKNSLFADTKGILPGAGIDIEPNNMKSLIKNISIVNCIIQDNYGAGIVIGLRKLENTSETVSIKVEKCVIRRNHSIENEKAAAELIFGANKTQPVSGEVIFKECLIEDSNWGLVYSRKRADAYTVIFDNCMVKNISGNASSPIIYLEVPNYYAESGALGGYTFNNLFVDNELPVYFLLVRGSSLRTLKEVRDITGHVILSGLRPKLVEYINYDSKSNQNVVFESIRLQD